MLKVVEWLAEHYALQSWNLPQVCCWARRQIWVAINESSMMPIHATHYFMYFFRSKKETLFRLFTPFAALSWITGLGWLSCTYYIAKANKWYLSIFTVDQKLLQCPLNRRPTTQGVLTRTGPTSCNTVAMLASELAQHVGLSEYSTGATICRHVELNTIHRSHHEEVIWMYEIDESSLGIVDFL